MTEKRSIDDLTKAYLTHMTGGEPWEGAGDPDYGGTNETRTAVYERWESLRRAHPLLWIQLWEAYHEEEHERDPITAALLRAFTPESFGYHGGFMDEFENLLLRVDVRRLG